MNVQKYLISVVVDAVKTHLAVLYVSAHRVINWMRLRAHVLVGITIFDILKMMEDNVKNNVNFSVDMDMVRKGNNLINSKQSQNSEYCCQSMPIGHILFSCMVLNLKLHYRLNGCMEKLNNQYIEQIRLI